MQINGVQNGCSLAQPGQPAGCSIPAPVDFMRVTRPGQTAQTCEAKYTAALAGRLLDPIPAALTGTTQTLVFSEARNQRISL